MLVYGVETVLTTGTCMWEAWLWDEKLISLSEKAVLLGGLYGAYFALGKFGRVSSVFLFCCVLASSVLDTLQQY